MMKKIAVILLSVFVFSGCSQSYKAEREFWKAEKLLFGIKKGELAAQGPEIFDPAIAAFTKIYEKYPSTAKAAESLFVVSNLYIRQKKYDEAVKTLEKVIQNFSGQPQRAAEARYGIAGIYDTQKNWQKAESLYWETAEYHPFHEKGLYAPIHIMIHYKKDKDQEGLETAYQKTLDYYKRMLKQTGPIQAASAIKNYLGLAHLTRGYWKKARTEWDDIAKEYPTSGYAPIAILASGELSWKREDLDAAVKSYEEYLKKYPQHNLVKRATVQLGMIYAKKKDYAKAQELFLSALNGETKDDVASDIMMLLAKTHQEAGDWAKADNIYSEVETKYKNTNAALQVPFMRAAYYQEKGNKEEAKKVLDEAIDRYGKLMQSSDSRLADFALRMQNAAYAEKGDWGKVIQNFTERMETEKSTLRKGNWAFLKAAVTERRLQDSKAAVLLYEKFLAEFPGHPYSQLAKARQELLLKNA